MVEFMTRKGPCELKIGTFHLTLQQRDHWVLWPLTFNTSRKEFSVEIKDEVLCALEKTDRTSLQMAIVSRDFMSPNSYIISYLDNTKIYQRHLLAN